MALSTFCGERYIEEQLESLTAQEKKPDRIYIRDDGSTDKTVQIIRTFAEKHHEIKWDIRENTQNKGWKKNFHDLILDVEEDLIFLCDQDDIWQPEKISVMTDTLRKHPKMELLSSDYEPIYMDNASTIASHYTIKGTDHVQQLEFDKRFMYVLRPGCTYAVKREFCQEIAPYWDDTIPHDAMLWRFSLIRDSGYIIREPLIKWRRYQASTSSKYYKGKAEESEADLRLKSIRKSIDSHLTFINTAQKYIENHPINKEKEKIIAEQKTFEKKYRQAIETGSIYQLLKLGITYREFFLSERTIFGDIAMMVTSKG